jgi:hypothetical protein
MAQVSAIYLFPNRNYCNNEVQNRKNTITLIVLADPVDTEIPLVIV